MELELHVEIETFGDSNTSNEFTKKFSDLLEKNDIPGTMFKTLTKQEQTGEHCQRSHLHHGGKLGLRDKQRTSYRFGLCQCQKKTYSAIACDW